MTRTNTVSEEERQQQRVSFTATDWQCYLAV